MNIDDPGCELERSTLLATVGINFSLPFSKFFESLSTEVRAQRRAVHMRTVDAYDSSPPFCLIITSSFFVE